MKTYLLIILLIFTFLSGCSQVSDETLRAAHIAVDNGAIILDVRTPKEYRKKHIKGAMNIPVEELHNLYVRLAKDKAIVVYCRSGNRSSTATSFLSKKGYTVYDVATQGNWERDVSIKH
jgi:phage shock protein E